MSNNKDENNFEPAHIYLQGKEYVIVPAEDAGKIRMSIDCHEKKCSNYRSVFISSVDVMVISDMTGKIVDVNPAVYEKFGYIPDEVIGKNQDILLPENLREKFHKFVEKINNKETPKSEFMGLKKNGEVFQG